VDPEPLGGVRVIRTPGGRLVAEAHKEDCKCLAEWGGRMDGCSGHLTRTAFRRRTGLDPERTKAAGACRLQHLVQAGETKEIAVGGARGAPCPRH